MGLCPRLAPPRNRGVASHMADRRFRIEELFHAALQKNREERDSFLSEACSDPDLKAEVESLIAAHELSGSFLDEPVLGPAARLIADAQTDPPVGERRPFLWMISIASVLVAALFVGGVFVLVEKGGDSASFGWSEEEVGNEWVVSQIDPTGPAAGRLETGDRIIEMNGL